MLFRTSKQLVALGACCVVLCVAITVEAQYNTYDSDSNSDSEGGPILSQAELGKLVRGSGHGRSGAQLRNLHNQQQQLAATRNLYNKQQALQYAPSHNTRRQYGDLSGYAPLASSRAHANNNDDDEDGGANFGPNFDGAGANDDDSNEGASNAPLSLNQAASGYPGDYSGDSAAAYGLGGFGASAGYGPSSSAADGAEFGPPGGDPFAGEGRRAKSASSLMGSRGYQGDEDSGAPQFGPNSAINAADADEEGRSNYAPDSASSSNNDDNDDE